MNPRSKKQGMIWKKVRSPSKFGFELPGPEEGIVKLHSDVNSRLLCRIRFFTNCLRPSGYVNCKKNGRLCDHQIYIAERVLQFPLKDRVAFYLMKLDFLVAIFCGLKSALIYLFLKACVLKKH